MNLVLFGPPGAGKGTQSQLLVEKMNLKHVSTGDLFRAAMKNKTPLGLEAQGFVDKGNLVPDRITIGLIQEVLDQNPSQSFLFDGFPRNVAQAEALDDLLGRKKSPLKKAVFLEVNRPLLRERLIGRRVCEKCGSTFHVSLNPPKAAGICDKCGGNLKQRPDDTAEVVDNRLEVYEKSTAPLKDYYKGKNLFVSVNGEGEPAVVYDQISKVLK